MTTCGLFSYGELGSCSITPQQYFECIDAFQEQLTFDNAGKILIRPRACEKVVEQCEAFKNDFGERLVEIPSCQSEEKLPEDVYDTNIYGADNCFATPSRFVVLGDSFSKCVGTSLFSTVGYEADACDCSWKNLAGYIRDNYAPYLMLEGCYPDDSIRGNIKDVAEDAKMITGEAGHIIVWISAIGWDLMTFRRDVKNGKIDKGDLRQSLDDAISIWLQDWQKLFSYFNDRSILPDGVTFMLNTIYSPTDQCSNADTSVAIEPLTPDEEEAIQIANEKVILTFARERADTVAVDVYPDVLGHDHFYNVDYCPYYAPTNVYWFSDFEHLNAKGYRHIAQQWRRVADRIYDENWNR